MALLSFREWVVFQPSFELGLYQFTWCVYCKGKCWRLSLEEVSRAVWVCQLPLAIAGSEERIYVCALPPTPWTTHSLPTFLSPLLITLRVACRVATKGWRKRRSPWLFGIYSTPLKTSVKNGNTTSWRCISYAKWWFSIVMLVFGGVPHCPRFTQWWIKWWLANCKVYPTLVNIVHFIRINYSDSKPPPTQRPAYPLSFIMILLMVQKSQTTTWDV